MNKILLSVFSLILVGSSQVSFASCPVPRLPSEFDMKERIISLTTSFKIKSGDTDLGKVTEKFFSLTRSFEYEDAKGDLIASARQVFFSWGVHIDVTDCSGQKIGSIKEQILKSLFKVVTVYSIFDARDNEVATSEKVDWISTQFTMRDRNGQVLATLKRPWINILTDKWHGTIVNPSAVDPRLLVMMSAYKTSVDNQRRKEAAAAAAASSSKSSDSNQNKH